MTIREKDPVRVRSGQAAMRARWGPGIADPLPPRILRLDSLSPAQRALIAAILDATTSEASPETAASGEATAGGTTDAAPST